jgi:HAUS augmin-like complex subunit 5
VKCRVGQALMATPFPPTDMTTEQALQSMRDTQHRALLLRAQAGAVRRQQRGLQEPVQRLQNQLRRLQDMERWASDPVATHAP